MPSQSSNQTALRTPGHAARVYAAFYQPATAAAGDITATASNPTTALAVSFTTGSASTCAAGFLVEIYSSASVLKGRTRIRYGQSITSSSLPVRELSWGTIKAESGDTFVVKRDVPLSDKLVAASVGFEPEGETYSDQGSNPPPVACSGGNWAGKTDDGQTYASITGAGSGSFTVDPDSGGSVTHVWTLPMGSGSFASGSGSTDANPVMEINVGDWLIGHTVTDNSNSKSTTQYVRYIVKASYDDFHECLLQGYSGNETDGFSADVQVFEDATLTTIADGAHCILFKVESIAGALQSFGAPVTGRSHILFDGYTRRDQTRFENGVETLTISVIGALMRYGELVGYSKVITNEASPDAWGEVKTLTTLRAILQTPQFYSNLNEHGCDFVVASNYTNQLYPQFFSNESTPLTQIRELAMATDGEFVCDRRGRLILYTPIDFLPLDDRVNVAQIIQATMADIVSFDITREHWRPIRTYRASGFAAGSTAPLATAFARWPGTPGEGNVQGQRERLIVDSSNPSGDLYERVGRHGARDDQVFTDSGNVTHFAPRGSVTFIGGYDTIFDFYGEVFRFAHSLTLRGVALDEHDLIIESVSVEYFDGTARTTVQFRAATNGGVGVDDTPPAGEPVDPPDTDPVEVITDPALQRNTVRLWSVCSNGYLWLTTDGGLTWTRYTPGFTGTLQDAVWNPHVSATVDLVFLTTTRFGTLADIGNARTLANIHTLSATGSATLGRIEMERATPNFAAAVSSAAASSTRLLVTENLTNATEYLVNSDGSSWAASGLYVSGRTARKLYVSENKNGSGATNGKVSTNAGATLATSTNPNFNSTSSAYALHFPFAGGETMCLFGYVDGTSDNRLYKAVGATQTDISYNDGGKYGVQFNRAIDTYPLDSNIIWYAGRRNGSGTSDSTVVLVSSNGGSSFTPISGTSGTVGSGYITGVRCAGNDPDVAWMFGFAGKIYKTANRGSSVIDISIDDGSVGNIVNIGGY